MLRNTVPGHETPLGYADLVAWRDMTGNLISSRDCAIIMSMDSGFRVAAKEVAKENAALIKRGKK